MKVLITQPIEQEAIRELRTRHQVQSAVGLRRHELDDYLSSCEVLIFRSALCIDAGLIQAAPQLKLLIRAGLGCDNVDRQAIRARGIKLLHVPIPRSSAILRAVEQYAADRTEHVSAIALHSGQDRVSNDAPIAKEQFREQDSANAPALLPVRSGA